MIGKAFLSRGGGIARRFGRGAVAAARRPRAFFSSGRLYGDKDSKLRSDIRMLGNTLGSIIKTHDRDAFEAVEKLRSCGREWRSAGGDEAAFDEAAERSVFDASGESVFSPTRTPERGMLHTTPRLTRIEL